MSDLIRREDLENWLRTECASIDTYEDKEYVIGRLREDLPTVNSWRMVEEPPKEYGNYLAVVNGEVMEVTYSDMRDDWKWSTCDAEGFVWIRTESVTHWMPMPEPPKEITNE